MRERILTPLQMTETVIAADDSNPTPGLATPHLTGGMETSHWWSSGYDPAGSSTRTTAADMAKFADAVLRGRAPGGDALTPRADASNGRKIGLAWDESLLWDPDHNMRLGTAYLGQLVDRFSGSYVLATAGYNAGPGRVRGGTRRVTIAGKKTRA